MRNVRQAFLLTATTLAIAACNGSSPGPDAATDTPHADIGPMDAADAGSDTASEAGDGGVMVCVPPDGDAPLPDLTIDPNELQNNLQFAVQDFNADACEIGEMCVGAPGRRTLLMFNTLTPNIGNADLDLGAASMSNPNFVYSTCHHHYHFLGYAQYLLLDPATGNQVAMGHKQSFCVEDLEQYETGIPGEVTNGVYSNCGMGGGEQGISFGWADEYYPTLPCQWIDVTDVPPGTYTLHVDLNYECRIVESDYTNNSAEATVVIPASWTTPAATLLHPCNNSTNSQGVGRDCGWSLLATAQTCTPGETVTVGCNAMCGVGSCTNSDSFPTYDIRVCAGSGACNGGDAMGVLSQDFGECGTGLFNLDSACGVAIFTCPAAGVYTVMGGADFAGDGTVCHLQTIRSSLGDAGADTGPTDAPPG